jgi:hypothetical protein
MTFGPSNTQGPFLPINQTFSEDEDQFLIQVTNRDRDIARYLNIREIGIYDLTQAPTGQQWFNSANVQKKRDAFRRVYTFTATGNIAHGITGLTQVMAYGEFTDGTNFYGAIYASSMAIAGQVTFYVSPTNIVIQAGAGAPSITAGVIVLDYLLN